MRELGSIEKDILNLRPVAYITACTTVQAVISEEKL